MAYVSVTGGQEAIGQAKELTRAYRLRRPEITLETDAVQFRLRLLADRAMSEAGLYEPSYAALAIKQAEGDPFESAFMLRAYRSTLPRVLYSLTMNTGDMRIIRRISSTFRDIPGGQVLGPTYDYAHRLLDFSLDEEGREEQEAFVEHYLSKVEEEKERDGVSAPVFTKVSELLRKEGLLAPVAYEDKEPFDITRQKLTFPAPRSARMQALARGETGAMTAFAYSGMRGYGNAHPTISELRVGYAAVHAPYPYGDGQQDADDAVYLGEVLVTEVETVHGFKPNKKSKDIQYELGYGLCYGQNELKAIAMSVIENSLENGGTNPVQDEEFVLMHIDSLSSSGFVGHLKLPHYVTFASNLDRVRQTKATVQTKETRGGGNDNKDAVAVQPSSL